jgi:hypothetical protein
MGLLMCRCFTFGWCAPDTVPADAPASCLGGRIGMAAPVLRSAQKATTPHFRAALLGGFAALIGTFPSKLGGTCRVRAVLFVRQDACGQQDFLPPVSNFYQPVEPSR